MGSHGSTIQLQESDLQELHLETGFSHNQIKRLYSRFSNLDKSMSGELSEQDFRRIPEFSINPLADRLLELFFNADGESLDKVNFRQFVRTLARFRPEGKGPNPLNSKHHKLEFAFKIYDIDNTGNIRKEDLLKILKLMVGDKISEEQLMNIAVRTIHESDSDKDGFINFEEFCRVMELTDFQRKMSIKFIS